MTDDDGLPVKLVITPGQTHDIHAAAELLRDIRKGQMLLADRAYDADWLREMVFEKGPALGDAGHHRQHRLLAVEPLDLALLIDAEHDRAGRRRQITASLSESLLTM